MAAMSNELRGLRDRERQLVRGLLAAGWTLHRQGNKHFRLRHPDGVHGVTFGGTSSDNRSWLNFRADIRRVERAVAAEAAS
jgi:predicted RNA binding protein YcfA (HicA-like mRNA interferase family)